MNRSAGLLQANRLKRTLVAPIVCGLLILLPACQIPRLRHAEAGPDLPLDYGISSPPSPVIPASATEPSNIVSVQPAGGIEIPTPTVQQANVPPKSTSAPSMDATGATGPGSGQQALVSDGVPSQNSAQLGIDEFFQDPTLTLLIHQALDNNRELKILNEEVQIARAEIISRRGAYLPFITGGAAAGTSKPSLFTPEGTVEEQLQPLPGVSFPNPLSMYRLSLDVFWTPDIWRQLRNARDAAIQRYLAARERRNFFVTRLVADVAENYYRLMAMDKRMENLNQTIAIQEQSLEIAKARKAAGRDTELPVQRFQAEVRKNQSEKLIVAQDIIEAENRINFLVNRFPQPVERNSSGFFTLTIHALNAGIPSELLLNRPDIRQAEFAIAAAGLDVKVARARFFPALTMTGTVGYEAFNPRYLFNPDALIASVAGNLVAPLINKKAIQADYISANASQLQAIYNYQRVVLNAFTEVVNRLSMVEKYSKSIEIRNQQLEALKASVESADKLFQNARVEYIDVLYAQRDLMDARMVLIDTKREQLSAIVNAYQALGGGDLLRFTAEEPHPPRKSFFSFLHWHSP